MRVRCAARAARRRVPSAPTASSSPRALQASVLRARGLFVRSRLGGGALRRALALPAFETPSSNYGRLPAELKHITKRRKRNQQGCP